MKKRILILSAAIVATVALAVPFAYAQHMRAHGMGMHGPGGGDLGPAMMLGHLGHLKSTLNLSDQQVSDIKAIFTDLRQQNAANRDQLHGGFKAVAALLLANPNDIAGAQALLDKQEAAEHTMKLNALNAASKALNVLTPEQRSQLADQIREHHSRFEK